MSDRLRGNFERQDYMSIIERRDGRKTPSLLFVETLGEVRINKLAAAMHRSVTRGWAVHIESSSEDSMDTGQA